MDTKLTIGQADGVGDIFSLFSLLFIYNNDAFSHEFKMMMDQSTTINKLLRAFQFRKHIKGKIHILKRFFIELFE